MELVIRGLSILFLVLYILGCISYGIHALISQVTAAMPRCVDVLGTRIACKRFWAVATESTTIFTGLFSHSSKMLTVSLIGIVLFCLRPKPRRALRDIFGLLDLLFKVCLLMAVAYGILSIQQQRIWKGGYVTQATLDAQFAVLHLL